MAICVFKFVVNLCAHIMAFGTRMRDSEKAARDTYGEVIKTPTRSRGPSLPPSLHLAAFHSRTHYLNPQEQAVANTIPAPFCSRNHSSNKACTAPNPRYTRCAMAHPQPALLIPREHTVTPRPSRANTSPITMQVCPPGPRVFGIPLSLKVNTYPWPRPM